MIACDLPKVSKADMSMLAIMRIRIDSSLVSAVCCSQTIFMPWMRIVRNSRRSIRCDRIGDGKVASEEPLLITATRSALLAS